MVSRKMFFVGVLDSSDSVPAGPSRFSAFASVSGRVQRVFHRRAASIFYPIDSVSGNYKHD
jgi:hypothetical protein